MKYEKRSELLHDALNFLDEDMIDEVEKLRNGETKSEITPITHKVSWRNWAALAASVCILISASIVYRDYLIPEGNVENTESGTSHETDQNDESVDIISTEEKLGSAQNSGQTDNLDGVIEGEYTVGIGNINEGVGKKINGNCKVMAYHMIKCFQNLVEEL